MLHIEVRYFRRCEDVHSNPRLRFGAAKTSTLFHLTSNSARAGRDVSRARRHHTTRQDATGPKRCALYCPPVLVHGRNSCRSFFRPGATATDWQQPLRPVSLLRGTHSSGGKLRGLGPAIPPYCPEVVLVCPCATSLLASVASVHLFRGTRMAW